MIISLIRISKRTLYAKVDILNTKKKTIILKCFFCLISEKTTKNNILVCLNSFVFLFILIVANVLTTTNNSPIDYAGENCCGNKFEFVF